jgi:hypothetical protein
VPIHAVVLDEHSYLHTVAQKCSKQADVPAASQQNQAGRHAARAKLAMVLQTQAGRRAALAKLAMVLRLVVPPDLQPDAAALHAACAASHMHTPQALRTASVQQRTKKRAQIYYTMEHTE